ncbi:hypothetical protein BUALT_Bualt02G0247100 [Buddleja alternifolia]|uniref:Uncharacterized protein n=1 Tax=Buddleja alternifolia TaxID=168488 RepID=A0AAV6Y9T4_9LAMI|nr:hypothetical protein BUALT_Bualt02G0247100 [Buddleja alternifolia]
MENSNSGLGFGYYYWLQWQVLVCALIIILPTAIAVNLLRKRGGEPVKTADLWAPCWRNLHPRWLLFYRAFAFAAMSFLLYQTVASFGFFVFFFYTQWTFALVVVYFALATIVSTRGCRVQARKPLAQSGERHRFLKKDSEEIKYDTSSTSKEKVGGGFIKLESDHNPNPDEEQVGFLENLLPILYQVSVLDIIHSEGVFLSSFTLSCYAYGHCLLVSSAPIHDEVQASVSALKHLIGCMHSLNAVFLLLESALNRLSFPWFGIIYFVFWSCAYIVFQWVLHACCFTWWPYPFLDLSTTYAPLWYLALALVHIPCYGLYVLLVKAKNAALSKMFPHSFVRCN